MNKTTRAERAAYWRAHLRAGLLVAAMTLLTAASTQVRADTGMCGGASTTLPFTDVPAANVFFCSIAEAYFSGLTNGTGPGVYSPAANVTREQMAAFVTRTMDQSLKRGSNRAALDQNWTIQGANNLASTTVGGDPHLLKSDGTDLWVANFTSNTVSQVRASDGKLVDTWTGATSAYGVLCAMGKVFVTGSTNPGNLYQIDPTQAAGPVTTVTSGLGALPRALAYDGQRIWTANSGSISIITLNPVAVTTIGSPLFDVNGIIYDGANIWVTDNDFTPAVDHLRELDSNGAVLRSVDVGDAARFPAFDGTNIWVPNESSNTVSVVRAAGALAGTVLATLTGNGLDGPISVAFDGDRILVANGNNGISLWKASDFTPIGAFSTAPLIFPFGACSDGLSFWFTLRNTGKVARL